METPSAVPNASEPLTLEALTRLVSAVWRSSPLDVVRATHERGACEAYLRTRAVYLSQDFFGWYRQLDTGCQHRFLAFCNGAPRE